MLQEKPKDIYFVNKKSDRKEIIITFLDVISFISLSLVIFGIFCLGFFVAPIIFKNIDPRPLASGLMTDIFLRYYPFAFICSLIALLSDSVRFFISYKISSNQKLQIVRLTCVLAICLITSYSDKKILTEINQMRLESKSPTLWNDPKFVDLHKQSEMLAKVSFTLGLMPLIIIIGSRKRL